MLHTSRVPRTLTDLNISGNNQITEDIVCAVVKQCALRRLWMADCAQISDTVLSSLAASMSARSLQDFCVNSPRVTDHGVALLLQACADLRSLHLGFCSSLTSQAFVGQMSQRIDCVSLRGLVALTDYDILPLLLKWHAVRALDLRGLLHISDVSVRTLSHMRNLRRLLLPDAPNITAAGVAALLRGCIELVELRASVFGTSPLSSAALQVLSIPGALLNPPVRVVSVDTRIVLQQANIAAWL